MLVWWVRFSSPYTRQVLLIPSRMIFPGSAGPIQDERRALADLEDLYANYPISDDEES